jgi:hypothetical protein
MLITSQKQENPQCWNGASRLLSNVTDVDPRTGYLPNGPGAYVPIDWVAEGTLTTPNSTSPNVWTWTDDGSKVQSDGSAYDDFPYW